MYTKRVQIANYGPIDQLDVDFPFDGDSPKPVLLVGENGSGKSILLSHLVNGLVSAKDTVYPNTPEVNTGKVYKIRGDTYIKSGREFYFAKVDFEDELFIEEIRLAGSKREDSEKPDGFADRFAKDAWTKVEFGEHEYFDSISSSGPPHIPSPDNKAKIEGIFSKSCVLYFPPNRFEEPAWLNEENLKATAKYMDLKHFKGYTSRQIITYSPLRDNQYWLFEVIYDRTVFEIQTPNVPLLRDNKNQPIPIQVFGGFSGKATSIYEIALQIARSIIKDNGNIRFGIGERHNRVVSIVEDERGVVPNIFQLSSGETSLLNLFLSILRDFDLSGAPFTKAEDIRGIVVVDEIDLHLHANHQYKILPHLMKMFPRVQFIVTTHSPLFVLGMKNTFGEDGFALYRLPQGHQISPEEFSEFGSAYETFAETKRFADDIREAMENAQNPIVFVEGATDKDYIQKAAELLNQQELLGRFELKDGGGDKNLDKVWSISKFPDSLSQKIVLLYDCDYSGASESKGSMYKKIIPLQDNHPVKKGIENLFSRVTLEKARNYKLALINIVDEHKKSERGGEIIVPEQWTVDKDEKRNLCDWLCENGTAEDFQHFQEIFDLLEKVLGIAPKIAAEQSQQSE